MYLESIQIQHVRNISRVSIPQCSRINIICGENGSGKTSLLEGISLLTSGHSFRTKEIRKVIQYGNDSLVVSGVSHCETGSRSIPIGIQKDFQGSTSIRVDSQSQNRLSALNKLLPSLAIHARSLDIIEGAPSMRRSLIDWGMFHVEHSYLDLLQSYRKAVSHKMKLLKSGSGNSIHDQIGYWNKVTADLGEKIDTVRSVYVSNISKHFSSIFSEVFNIEDRTTIHYKPGWNQDKYDSLLDCLNSTVDQEVQRRTCLNGPHRGDLSIMYSGIESKDICSRGQKKLVLYGVRLAQIAHMNTATGRTPIVLLDDLPSELDKVNQNRIMKFLSLFDCQCFITAIDQDLGSSLIPSEISEFSMFHVKHGTLT